jgi:hypothetical protein
MKQRTADEAREWFTSWAKGDLSYMLRPDGQSRIASFVKRCRQKKDSAWPIQINAHRRLGKSFLLLALLIGRALQRPRTICKYGAPTYDQVKKIVLPNMEEILSDCPKQFMPRRVGYDFYFKNPAWKGGGESIIELVGVDYRKGDRLRGASADGVVLDECAYMVELDYLVKFVVAPQLIGRKNRLFLMCSTPGASMAHDWSRPGGFIDQAIRRERYMKVGADENKDFSEEDRQIVLDIAGGEETTAWKREALCELVAEETQLIVPEYRKLKQRVEYSGCLRPEAIVPYVVMDTGYVDYTACLFMYLDFEKQQLDVENLIWEHYKSTGELADLIKGKFSDIYSPPQKELAHWYADCTVQQLEDLSSDHDVHFMPVEKYDRQEGLAKLRTAFQRGRIRINRDNCQPLIYQCENATWNERRNDFARNRVLGHCDALVALMYANRMVDWDENRSEGAVYVKETQWRNPEPEPEEPSLFRALKGWE